jgi:hypothetical protein
MHRGGGAVIDNSCLRLNSGAAQVGGSQYRRGVHHHEFLARFTDKMKLMVKVLMT